MMQAVIFDLDDTLAPEAGFIESGYHAIAAHMAEWYGLPETQVYEKLTALFLADKRNVFNRLLDSYGLSYGQEEIRSLVERYRNHRPAADSYRLYEDAQPALRELREQGMRLGLLTDGYAVSQRNKIEALGISGWFEEIVVTDELGREYWKPDRRGFELLQQRMGLPFSDMCYVGDNPAKDFYITKHHPMRTVRVLRPGSVYETAPYLEGVREQRCITSLSELAACLI